MAREALRDRVALRVIAIDRMIHFLILAALGIGLLAIAGNADALRSRFYRASPTCKTARPAVRFRTANMSVSFMLSTSCCRFGRARCMSSA
jgi:hypothetical protein